MPTALILAAAGWIGLLVVVGPEGWPLLLGWLVGILLTAAVWSRAGSAPRIVVALVLALSCVPLIWLGGLFFLPSAVMLLTVAIKSAKQSGATTQSP